MYKRKESYKMKIVMPEYGTLTIGDIDMSGFEKFGDLQVLDCPSRSELKAALKDADILFVNKTSVDEDLLEYAEKLVYVGECATGFNNIDLDYCKSRGITVTNVPAYSTNAVAQLVFAFILEHFSKVHAYDELVRADGWINSPVFSVFDIPMEELDGKTLGLFGYGQIGSKVAKISSAFGMKVYATTRSRQSGSDEYTEFVPFDTLLEKSEIISCHCPLNPESEKILNAEAFAKMQKGAYFINTSRGPVVDEAALAQALKSGHLSGASVDVLETEPMSKDCPLIGIENCVITPHMAWAPKDTRQRLVNIVTENLNAYLEGHPQNVVGG